MTKTMDKINPKSAMVIDTPESGVAWITDLNNPAIEYLIGFDVDDFEAWFRDYYGLEDHEEAEQDDHSVLEYLKSGGKYTVKQEMFNRVSATLFKFINCPDGEEMARGQVPSRMAYEMDEINRTRNVTDTLINGMLDAIKPLR